MACATPPACLNAPAPAGDVAYVVAQGWHTELGLPAREITGGLATLRDRFPQAQTLLFGFGKRDYFTAKTDADKPWLLAPISGPGAVQVTGLAGEPVPDGGMVIRVALPPGSAARLSDHLWAAIARDAAGQPRPIGPGPVPASEFFIATENYSLNDTCNRWVVQALRDAGLPTRPRWVFVARQTLHQAEALPGASCRQP